MQQGMKWLVENQGSDEGVVTVEITDKKHQVRRCLLFDPIVGRGLLPPPPPPPLPGTDLTSPIPLFLQVTLNYLSSVSLGRLKHSISEGRMGEG